MNVLIDTNIAIDVLIKREPFFENSRLVFLAAEQKFINGFISASAITDIYYVIKKFYKDKTTAKNLLKSHLMKAVDIAAVDGEVIAKALSLDWGDFEDCVQYNVGESISADYIVTRNPKDFEPGKINIVTPDEFLDIIAPEE